jgi:uncharacterized iron-regulated membrane protein
MTDDQEPAHQGKVAGWGYWLVTVPVVVILAGLIISGLVKWF